MTQTAAQILGKFASELKFTDIPPAVVERAKNCIIDTVAAARFGAQFPWSRKVVGYAQRYGNGGPCSIIGTDAADFIYAGGGNDIVFARAGEDFVFGDGGNDLISGDEDNDLVLGGSANDKVFGASGNDTVFGDDGDD